MSSLVFHRLFVMPVRVLIGLPTVAAVAIGVAGWRSRNPHARRAYR